MTRFLLSAAVALLAALPTFADDPWLSLPGTNGKHIVLVSGDEEYRSEEGLTQLGKILSARHGFKCTVLYAIDPKTGFINPNQKDNIPGLEALKTADLMVILTRFRDLPDVQMQQIVDYVESGKPVVGLRTATHAFNTKNPKFAKWSWGSKEKGFEGGFGRVVLGETWVAHHGGHNKEGTRCRTAPGQESHPILKGVKDGTAFGTTDVYTVRLPLPEGCTPILMGEVTDSLKPDSVAVTGKKNDPMMPVAWTKTYTPAGGKPARVFTTTMGTSQDFSSEGTRRFVVNGCLWVLGMEDKIGDGANVEIVGDYKPTHFGNNKFVPNVKPADLAK